MGSKVRRRKTERQDEKGKRNDRGKKHKRGSHAGPQCDREAAKEPEGEQRGRDPESESDGACIRCWIRDRCMEQRGRCALFKTPKQARKEAREDAKRINENFGKKPAGDESEDED